MTTLLSDYTFPDYADLFDSARADILKRCTQRQLADVFNICVGSIDPWLEVKAKSDAFAADDVATHSHNVAIA